MLNYLKFKQIRFLLLIEIVQIVSPVIWIYNQILNITCKGVSMKNQLADNSIGQKNAMVSSGCSNKAVFTNLRSELGNIRSQMSRLIRVKSQQNVAAILNPSEQTRADGPTQNGTSSKIGGKKQPEIEELKTKIANLEKENAKLLASIIQIKGKHAQEIQELKSVIAGLNKANLLMPPSLPITPLRKERVYELHVSAAIISDQIPHQSERLAILEKSEHNQKASLSRPKFSRPRLNPTPPSSNGSQQKQLLNELEFKSLVITQFSQLTDVLNDEVIRNSAARLSQKYAEYQRVELVSTPQNNL